MRDEAIASTSPLDRPVWHALTGRQSGLAVGDGRAVRFRPEIGPLAACANADDASALADLAGDGEIWIVEKTPPASPPGMTVVRSALCCQMIASSITPQTRMFDFHDLGDGDAAEMFALATLTAPGPFAEKTHMLGGFIGIRENGRLLAMAGERMKPGMFTEVSGVCTHPDARGRGYAGFLMRVVASRILERGERPFLHSYANNAGAIALYRSLGFAEHQSITAIVLKRG
ncbi:MAG: GNAT family N-acetyltransferase [Sphingobium sp.]|uniref:GNAT family N-acetyltransferase n=1 Tax=Sphingobium sp. TaxID=1912891 RepID=UPI0029B2D1AD|nr:GNAT family N-acetyltransferase [Sphingobium sp.]MDX3908637.1 GNAT family N-acetyltransferase [Sphingobium sp.]